MGFPWFWRRAKPSSRKEADTASKGFVSLVNKLKTYSEEGIGGVLNSRIVPFTLSAIFLTVRVLLNVAVALEYSSPAYLKSESQKRRVEKEARRKQFQETRPKSVHSRPLNWQKKEKVEADALSETASSLSFVTLRSKSPQLSLHDDSSLKEQMMSPNKQQNLLFVATHLEENNEDPNETVCSSPDPPATPRGSVDLEFEFPEVLETSPFFDAEDTKIFKTPDLDSVEKDFEMLQDLDPSDSLKQGKLEEIMEGTESMSTIEETKIEEEENEEQAITRCVSPCSSLNSNFSDSVAVKFANSNFCNPEYYEDPGGHEQTPRAPFGGSIRQRYTMRRLQSMLSRRSTVSPRLDEQGTPRTFRKNSSRLSRRSINRSFSRGLSFRSKDEAVPELSKAYSFIRLETCIRKAWQMSADSSAPKDTVSDEQCTGAMRSELKSIKRQFSRRSARGPEISFVHVPVDPADGLLLNKDEVVLNPYYGDEASSNDDDHESTLSQDDSVVGRKRVQIKTPLDNLTSQKESYAPCQKNLDEGTYDNPLELWSFRSYDSDTELELTSFRFRNPISKLLSLDITRGISKDGIPLAEIEEGDYGDLMLGEVGNCPIRDSMLEKYLTQVVINEAIEEKGVEDTEDVNGGLTPSHEHVPQELDSGLRFLLLERFLLDNVFYEMDVNLEAMELARIKDTQPTPASRRLRRS